MNTLLLDLRQSLRSLGKSPGFLVATVLSLALGIGVNTATFSALRAALHPQLDWKDPQQLYDVGRRDVTYPVPGAILDVTYPTFKLWQESQTVLAPMAAYDGNVVILGGPIEPRSTIVSRVSPEFWPLLGVSPKLGRLPGAGEEEVMVVSHKLWVSALGADPAVIGRSFVVDGRPRAVVGVLPAEAVWRGIEAFVPLVPTEQEQSGSSSFLLVAGRTRPGVTEADVKTAFSLLSSQLQASEASQQGITAVPQRLMDRFYGRLRDRQLLLFWASLFVTALACANLCILALGRSASRVHELGIRQALGAGRGRLFVPLFADLLVAAGPGLLLGWMFSTATRHLLDAFVPGDLQVFHELALGDLAVATGVALLLAVVGATLPALLLPGLRTFGLLSGTRTSGSPAKQWSQKGLVVVQVALAVTLLSGFGLVYRSLHALRTAPIGIRAENRILATLSLPARTPEEAARLQREVAEVQEKIRALPGVEASGGTNLLPVASRGGFNGTLEVPGQAEPVFSYFRSATDGYFEAAGIPLVEGRTFRPADIVEHHPQVLIVSRSFAEDYFPGQSVVGRTLPLPGWDPAPTIVGVVADAQMDDIRQEGNTQTLYLPPTDESRLDLVIKASAGVETLLPAVRRVLRAQWPDVSLDQVRPLSAALERGTAAETTQVVLVGLLAALALLLTVAGIYGVLSGQVTARRKEMGIRLALGGQPGQILGLVLRQAMAVVSLGLVLGFGGAIGLGHAIRSQLFRIKPLDAPSHLSMLLLLAGFAWLAAFVPARRASRIDPCETLRDQ